MILPFLSTSARGLGFTEPDKRLLSFGLNVSYLKGAADPADAIRRFLDDKKARDEALLDFPDRRFAYAVVYNDLFLYDTHNKPGR